MNVETIILDNIKYIILNKLNVNGNEYLYVIDSREDNDNISILKKYQKNGIETVVSVTDEEEKKVVFQLFDRQNEGK